MKNKAIYLPGLNGLRAIASIGVVVSHITLGLAYFGLNPYLLGRLKNGTPKGLDLAGFGVDIFFALSGFLITYLLCVEKDKQYIQIKKFYLRRILRIWPLYYLYFFISLLIILYFGFKYNFSSLLLYLFYAANIPFILRTALPFLDHYWSLGVEEQFYLFWPWVIKTSNSKIVLFITSILFVLIGAKIIFHFFYPELIVESLINTIRFQCMIIGALAAILYKQHNRLFLKSFDNKISQIIAWAIIILVAINKFHIASILDHEIISVVTVIIITGQINIKNRIINLEMWFFDFLGKISYGIYVYHPLLIFLLSKVINRISIRRDYKYALVYLSVIGITILLAYISYEYFEKYFLKLKDRFAVVQSSGTKLEQNKSELK